MDTPHLTVFWACQHKISSRFYVYLYRKSATGDLSSSAIVVIECFTRWQETGVGCYATWQEELNLLCFIFGKLSTNDIEGLD